MATRGARRVVWGCWALGVLFLVWGGALFARYQPRLAVLALVVGAGLLQAHVVLWRRIDGGTRA